MKATPKRPLRDFSAEVRDRVSELMGSGWSDEAIVEALRETAPELGLADVNSWRQLGFPGWLSDLERLDLVVRTAEQAGKVLAAKSDSADVNRANAVVGAALAFVGLWALAAPRWRRKADTDPQLFARALDLHMRRNEAAQKLQNAADRSRQDSGLSQAGLNQGETQMELWPKPGLP